MSAAETLESKIAGRRLVELSARFEASGRAVMLPGSAKLPKHKVRKDFIILLAQDPAFPGWF